MKLSFGLLLIFAFATLASASHHKNKHQIAKKIDDDSENLEKKVGKEKSSKESGVSEDRSQKNLELVDDEQEEVVAKSKIGLRRIIKPQSALVKKEGHHKYSKFPVPKISSGKPGDRNFGPNPTIKGSPFSQMGCPEWEGDCRVRYSNHSEKNCDKKIPICTFGYFRSKDGKTCVSEQHIQDECGVEEDEDPVCPQNEEYVTCPQCPDAWCDIITCPLSRDCDLTKTCSISEVQGNYCRLDPKTDCFEPPCPAHAHYDRCPRCADLTCDTVHIIKVEQRNSANCYEPGCICDEGYVREFNGSGTCVPVQDCIKKCGQNEHYEGRVSSKDVPSTNGMRKGVDYCAQPGCKCNNGYARADVNGKKNVCVKETDCPNLPKNFKPSEPDAEGCHSIFKDEK
uniref:TIL domain-containing protein n=1 Tax=Ditylenchus dipsaci TaxID=166011 RepID=A0A915ERZ7_9BILA